MVNARICAFLRSPLPIVIEVVSGLVLILAAFTGDAHHHVVMVGGRRVHGGELFFGVLVIMIAAVLARHHLARR
jgi:hypothetical protein